MIKTILGAITANKIMFKRKVEPKTLYLTFDDGPSQVHTPAVLDLLKEHQIQATFFFVGREVVERPEIVNRTVLEGHALGNHSIIHPRMDFLSNEARLREIRGMDRLLSEFDHRAKHLFRPPYGKVSLSLFSFCLLNKFDVAMWSRDSMDYKGNADEVTRGLMDKPVSDGDIILFHDDGGACVQALTKLLPVWKAKGYRFGQLVHESSP